MTQARGVTGPVHALVNQDYPAGRRDVIVIADNCTDDPPCGSRVARRSDGLGSAQS